MAKERNPFLISSASLCFRALDRFYPTSVVWLVLISSTGTGLVATQ
jgi:hypothetical protein